MHFLAKSKISVIRSCIRFILLWLGSNLLSLNSSDLLGKYKTMESIKILLRTGIDEKLKWS